MTAVFYKGGYAIHVESVTMFGIQYLTLAKRCKRIGADYFIYNGKEYKGRD